MEKLFLIKEQSVTFTGHRFIPYGKSGHPLNNLYIVLIFFSFSLKNL